MSYTLVIPDEITLGPDALLLLLLFKDRVPFFKFSYSQRSPCDSSHRSKHAPLFSSLHVASTLSLLAGPT